jgi:hypothetical protein
VRPAVQRQTADDRGFSCRAFVPRALGGTVKGLAVKWLGALGHVEQQMEEFDVADVAKVR